MSSRVARSADPAHGSSPSAVRASFLAAALAALAGCVTVDGTLKPDGSGTLEVTYHMMPNSTEAIEKRRFTSPQVTLESLKVHEDGTATANLAFADPTELSTVEMFRAVSISRRREGNEERLAITITNEKVADVKDETRPGPRITITLPGAVLEANRNATIDGSKVTWRLGLAEFVREKTVELTARYRVPAGADAR